VVYVLAVAGLSSGVGVSALDLAGSGIAERAYYALGLFVLGGLDIGTPVGGPLYGRVLLWTAYFIAPVITASALIEAAARIIQPLSFRLRSLDGHVVVAGAGRLARLYARKLRDRDARRTLVVVDRDPSHPSVVQLRDLYRALIVGGDITSDDVLRGLRLERAHRVLLLTDDDFANLDAAAKIMKLAPDIGERIVAHVSDLGFMRETAESSVARVCETFNGHEFAAVNLVREHLLRRFHSTPHRDLVILAGFGRFGQTVLHQLQQHARGSFDHVVIIDEDAEMNARIFEEEPGFADGYEHAVVNGDLLDPELWRCIGEVVRAHGHDPVVIMGSGNDGTNLHAALMVRKRHPGAYVIVRTFGASPFTAEVAREAGVQAFNLRELLGAGMPETWF
jgi:Trk K+ transport system NAD-binding subunit